MSSSFCNNRLVLEALHFIALGKGFLRYRNPRRKRAGGNRKAFNEQAWREAAASLGASWRPLGSGFCEIELDGVRTRVTDNMSAIDDPVTLGILHDKPLTHRILSDARVSVPKHVAFKLDDLRPAMAFLKSTSAYCVVKPAAGTGGGAGVATGIRTNWQLARAAAAAAVYSDSLLIEEQVEGDNYRLLYLDGELLDGYVRKHPSVIGDGKSSVAALVGAANEERLAKVTGVSQQLLTVDMDMKRTLARQGLSLRSVPVAGQRVTIKTAINENSGSDNTTVTKQLCRSIVEDGSRAAKALGARFAGIDIVANDITIPLAESGGVVLEVNGTPNLYFHYHKADGSMPVAVHAMRRLLAAGKGHAGDRSAKPNPNHNFGALVQAHTEASDV
jgi:cyanophycin synthetase